MSGRAYTKTLGNAERMGSSGAATMRRDRPPIFGGSGERSLDALISGGRPMGTLSHAPDSESGSHSPDTPTSVYRYLDRRGLLLYVGVTSRGIRRNREHNATKEWWPYVVSQQVEHYPTRTAALRAEKKLILEHRPPFNTAHNPEAHLVRAAYVYRTQPGDYALAQNLLYTGNARVTKDGQQVGWVSKYTFKAVSGFVRLKLDRSLADGTNALLTYCRNSNDAPDRLRILSVVLWGGVK